MAGQGSGSAALLLLSILAVVCPSALAKTHSIAWQQGVDYSTWSTDEKLASGDDVVFTYTSLHTATVVSEADYNSCTGNALSNVPSGGSLTVTRDTYVICTTVGHCSGGMKIALKPTSTPTTPTTPSTPSTPGTTPSTPTTPPTTPSTPSTREGSSAPGLKAATATIVASIAIVPLFL